MPDSVRIVDQSPSAPRESAGRFTRRRQ